MNTLLGEVATLNDVQYHRYRTAFKFRKLQKTFQLDHLTVGTLQDVFHQTGVQNLPRTNEVFLTQMRSTLNELYSSLKVSKPLLRGGRLQQAQEQLFNWLQMAYKCSSGNKIEAGTLKVTLALLTGSNSYDKARYFFSVLANVSGAVDVEGIGYFLSVTQQLASSVQEHLYPHWRSAEEVFRECLQFVRSAEDLEDEEEWDGSFRNQFLSQFEFTKLFTTLPEPKFLQWMALWHRLPTMEKVVHFVRCAVCTRKPIIAFRYQCTQCPSYSLCQMCFLKGRTTDKHLPTHKMLEFTTPTKGQWRFLGFGSRNRGGRAWTEPKEPFIYSPRTSIVNFLVPPKKKKESITKTSINDDISNGQVDAPINSITEMISDSQETARNSKANGTQSTHQPAIIRIGSGDTPTNSITSSTLQTTQTNSVDNVPRTEPHPPMGHVQPMTISTCSSSPDSVSSGGQRFNYDGPFSCASSDLNATRSSLGNISTSTAGSEGPMYRVQSVGSRYRTSTIAHAESALPLDLHRKSKGTNLQRSNSYTSRDKRQLAELNKRLSMEVDQLLSELPSDYPPSTDNNPVKTNTERLHKLHMEERTLQNQVNRLRNQRERLATELQGLITQVQHMHSGFVNMRNGVRTPSPPGEPVHVRYDSAPSQVYPREIDPKLTSVTHSQDAISSNSRLHRHAHLLDPLVEFSPEQLKEEAPENYRLSVAW